MKTEEEVQLFDQSLAKIAANPDAQYLPRLLLVFDDACEHHEVMFGLLHFLEDFHTEEVLQALKEVIHILPDYAMEWLKIMHYRILNDGASRVSYQFFFQGLPLEEQAAFRQILEDIATESLKLKQKVASILANG
ncbi:MAG: Imm30 family immunity protein [Chloroflexota bacterium]